MRFYKERIKKFFYFFIAAYRNRRLSTISERSEESNASANLLFRPDSPGDQAPQTNQAGTSQSAKSSDPVVNPQNNSAPATNTQQTMGQTTTQQTMTQASPQGTSIQVELQEADLQVVKKHMRDVEKGSGYIRLSGKPDVVLQIQDGYATMRKKKPVPIIEPL